MGIEAAADLTHLMEVYLRRNFNADSVSNPSFPLTIPHLKKNQLYKCRILYDTQIHKIEFVPYTFKIINSLQLVHVHHLDYSHKFADRSALQSLLQKKGKADEILIVQNGFITDTSYSNVAFFDGLQWFTPAKPLLRGTKRAALLEQKKIIEADIRVEDLKDFQKMQLINAMIDWGDFTLSLKSVFQIGCNSNPNRDLSNNVSSVFQK